MTESLATRWPRAVLDDLADRLAGDPWWGQVGWSDERLAELLNDPRAAEPWPIIRPLPPGADMARVIEASRAPCRLGEHSRAARRAAMTEEERAAVDAEAEQRRPHSPGREGAAPHAARRAP